MVLLKNSGMLGMQMPHFELTDVNNRPYRSHDESAEVLVVMFICGHCPYVNAIENRLSELDHHFNKQSVKLLGICSNDPIDYPEDSREALKQRVIDLGIPFTYLVDESQEVARAFGAVCTPDLFVFDKSRVLRYHGELDDNWKDETAVTKQPLKEAIKLLLSGTLPSENQVPTMGCSIKWKN